MFITKKFIITKSKGERKTWAKITKSKGKGKGKSKKQSKIYQKQQRKENLRNGQKIFWEKLKPFNGFTFVIGQ